MIAQIGGKKESDEQRVVLLNGREGKAMGFNPYGKKMNELGLTYLTGLILPGNSSPATPLCCFLSFNPFHEAVSTEKYKES